MYTFLAYRGFFDFNVLKTYCKDGTKLGGHPKRQGSMGIEVSTGSLGHGLSIGVGISLANKSTGYKSIILVGDGECNEGSIWEAAMFALSNNLSNIIVIINNNGWQGLNRSSIY